MAIGRHRTQSPEAERRARVRTIISVMSMAIVAILLAGGAWTVLGAHGGCPSGTVANVAAAPDMANALQTLANRYNSDPDSCGKVQVTEQDSADVLNTVTGRSLTPSTIRLDAWVPESSFWLNLARADIAATDASQPTTPSSGAALPARTPPLPLRPTGISVARSPVVLTGTTELLKKMTEEKVKPSWRLLLGQWVSSGSTGKPPEWLDPMFADPARNVSGLVAMEAARSEMEGGSDVPARLTGFIRGAQKVAAANQAAVVDYLGSNPPGGIPIGVASEQSVWYHNEFGARKKLAAFYPPEGTATLDYPYAITASPGPRERAAEKFGELLRSGYARGLMAQLGFRDSKDRASPILRESYGVNPATPKLSAHLGQNDLELGLRTWNRLGLNSRILVLADRSQTIGQAIPGSSKTRLQVAAEAARSGLGLFPDDTDMGLWTFATHQDGDRPYKEEVPLGRLTDVIDGETRRQRLYDVTGTIKPETSGGSGLYDTILAGYREVKRTYRDDRFQSVLLLVGSRNTTGRSLDSLLNALSRERDPSKPIEINAIGFGDAVDANALNQITKPTGGGTYTTDDPEKIGQIFLQAVSRRVCTPECPR